MRNTTSLSSKITDIQLSSPLPSPNPQLMNNNQQPIPVSTTSDLESIPTSSESIQLAPLIFEPPYALNTSLYPLAHMETPQAMKKFNFDIDGKPCKFEEIQVKSSLYILIGQFIHSFSL